jgi:hypothetical protein
MPQPDMTRQYRRELAEIARHLRAIDGAIDRVSKDAATAHARIDRLIARLGKLQLPQCQIRAAARACSRVRRAIARICRRDADGLRRTRERLLRRQSILEGRLD